MEYIAHKRYKGKAINRKDINLPRGSMLETVGDYIIDQKGNPVCFRQSEIAHKYFARNDDGNGLERGEITFAIAYKARNKSLSGSRFSAADINLLLARWRKYLRPLDVVLFNDEFFNAPINELRRMKGELNV